MRAGTIGAGLTLMLLISSPAFALTRYDGDDPGPGLSIGETLGYFVGLPILLFAVIAFLVCLPDIMRKGGNKR